MVLRIDAASSRQYLAVLSAVRAVPKEIQAQIRAQTKVLGTPEWQSELAQQATTRLEHRVIVGTARVNASNQNVQLAAATTGKVRRGVKNVDLAAAVEFGANRNQTATYDRRSKNGGSHSVTRHASNQLRWRNRKGYVFYPAAARMIPRIAALWAQTTVRTVAEALEGRK